MVRDASGQRYQLGHAVLGFVDEGEALDVRQLCHPLLARLHTLTGASVFLSIVVGRYNVCLETIQGKASARRLHAASPTHPAPRRRRLAHAPRLLPRRGNPALHRDRQPDATHHPHHHHPPRRPLGRSPPDPPPEASPAATKTSPPAPPSSPSPSSEPSTARSPPSSSAARSTASPATSPTASFPPSEPSWPS